MIAYGQYRSKVIGKIKKERRHREQLNHFSQLYRLGGIVVSARIYTGEETGSNIDKRCHTGCSETVRKTRAMRYIYNLCAEHATRARLYNCVLDPQLSEKVHLHCMSRPWMYSYTLFLRVRVKYLTDRLYRLQPH